MRIFSLKRIKFAVVGESKGEFAPLVIQEGSETQLKGCPTVLSPISVRTEIGCPARHERKNVSLAALFKKEEWL